MCGKPGRMKEKSFGRDTCTAALKIIVKHDKLASIGSCAIYRYICNDINSKYDETLTYPRPSEDSGRDLTGPMLEHLSNCSLLIPQLQMLSSVFRTAARAVYYGCPLYCADRALSSYSLTVSRTDVMNTTAMLNGVWFNFSMGRL